MNQLLSDLLAIDALLSSEEKWTQRYLARDEYGLCCNPQSPDAIKWCFAGALLRIDRHLQLSSIRAQKILKAMGKLVGYDITQWQDSHTFSELKAVLRAEIEARRSET